MNHVSRRLAARTGIRQVQALTLADRVQAAVERVILRTWKRTLLLCRESHLPAGSLWQQALKLWQILPQQLQAVLAGQLVRVAKWGHTSSRQILLDTVPHPVREAVTPRQALARLILPAPSPEKVARVVYGRSAAGSWQQRLTTATALAAPQQIASVLATGMVQGQSPQEIEQRLRPVVQSVRNTSRRIARTETLRVAHETQLLQWDALGDDLVGYQIIATLDSHTRPWHALRNGRIYYRNPKPGQDGLKQMPHPPLEPEDPRERPVGTPQIAWN